MRLSDHFVASSPSTTMRTTSAPPASRWATQAKFHPWRHSYSILLLLPLLLSVLLTPNTLASIDPCANSTTSHSLYVNGVPYCYLYNFTLTSNVSQDLVPTILTPPPVITLTDVHLTVLNATNTYYPHLNELTLDMAAASRIELVNTTLHAPYIWIYSGGSIDIDNSSHVSADGFAPSGLPTNLMPQSNLTAGTAGGGGGGGGIGGYGCVEGSARGGAATGDPVTPPNPPSPSDCGGPGSVAVNGTSGGVAEGFGFGGGFVQIQIVGKDSDLSLAGAITASGTDATHGTLAAGGGAGGFVSLLVPNGRIVGADDGKVEVNGGAGVNNGGGGAGGRIYIDGGVNSYNVRAYGGRSGTGCQAGGQGTIYIVSHNGTTATDFVELRCVGQEPISTSLVAATDFSNSSTVDRLDLTYCNLLASSATVIKQQLSMIASRLQPNAEAGSSGGRTLRISVPSLETSGESSIEADYLYLDVDTLQMGSAASVHDVVTFTAECTINASTSIDVWGTLRAGQWHPEYRSTPGTVRASVAAARPVLTLIAPDITLEAGSLIDGDTAAAVVQIAASHQLQLLSAVTAGYQRPETNCSDALSAITPNSTCSLLPQTFSSSQSDWTPWSTLSITAGELIVGTGGTIQGSVLAVCSDTDVTLQAGAKLMTTGNGCPSGMGAGAGTAPTANPGGGGGHGGAGGEGMPGGSGAGAAYDKGSWPVMAGSGGSAGTGGGVGGAGGGFIYLSTGLLTLGSGASIVSDGTPGAGKGSGGGSGGSVLLHINAISAPANLSIHPTISARGGDGTSASAAAAGGSAGGGGGGRIYVQWTQLPLVDQANAVSFIVDPGSGLELVNVGEPGAVVAEPPCPPGFSGVLCIGCARGQFKNVSGAEECLPCLGGYYTNTTNSTSCNLCGEGFYAPSGQALCSPCADGYISDVGQANCTKCSVGEEANGRHTECNKCVMGTYKPDNDTKCVNCPVGRYSTDDRTNCLDCPDLPSHAHYVMLQGSQCPYECEVGFLPPDCLTPFNAMVQSIGGWFVFVGLLAVSVAVTFVPFLCCFIRSKRRQRERELLEMDDAETESESDSLPPSPPPAQRLPSAVAVGYDRSQLVASLLEPSIHHSLQDLPSTSLQPRHYPHFLHRIFLSGDNCWQRPLRLSRRVPSEVSPLVFEDEYSVFAEDVSKRGRWRGWEEAVHYLLMLVCLPLAASWTRWRRSVHARAVWLYVLNYDHSMLRNAKSRALASSLLFGCSSCHTLAWIDVLANHSEEREAKQTGLPCLPLTLIAAGDGSYHTPFHFDVSDAFNKVVAEYVGVNYFKFLRAVNAALRPIRRTQLKHEKDVRQLMQFLNIENHMGIGIGKHLPLGGVKVELGWVGPDAGVGGGMLPALVVTVKEELAGVTNTTSGERDERMTIGVTLAGGGGGGLSSRLPNPRFSRTDLLFSRPPPFRRDDRSPQSSDSGRDAQLLSQSYNSAHSYLTSDEEEEGSQPSIMERALGQEGRKKVEAYLNAKQRMEAEQRRLQQKKSTSYASLPAPNAGEGSGYRTFGATEGGWGRGSEAAVPKRKKKQRDGIHEAEIVFGERKEDDEPSSLLDTSSSSIADMVPSQPLPYSACVYHFTPSRSSSASATPTLRHHSLSLNSSTPRTQVTSSLSSTLTIPNPPPSPSVSLAYRLQGLALFNLPLYMTRTWLACVFLLLVLIRCGLLLMWLSSSFQLVRWLFWFSLLLYPAIPLATPLMGLAVLVSSSVHCCRIFACCVLLSFVNDAVVVAGSAYSFNVQLGVIDALLLPPLTVITSLLLLLTANAYVAHLEVLKDLVKGRRDYGKEREGEEGFMSNSPQSSRRSSRRSSLDSRTLQGHQLRHSSRDKRHTRSRRSTATTTVAGMVEPQSSNSPYTPSSEPATPIQYTQSRHDLTALTSPETLRTETTSEPMPIPYPQPAMGFAAPGGALTPIMSASSTTPMSPPMVPLPPAATLPSPTSQMSMLSQSLAAQQMAQTPTHSATPTTLPEQSEEGSEGSRNTVSVPSPSPSPSSSSSSSSNKAAISTNPSRASGGLPPAPRSSATAAGGRKVRVSTAAGRGGARGGSSTPSASPRVSPRTSTTPSPRTSATPSPRGKAKRGAAK